VTLPDGAARKVSNRESDRAVVNETDLPGVYRVRWEKAKADVLYAVSLLDPGESDIAAAPSIPMGDATVSGKAGSAFVRREATMWLVMVAVAILLAEWVIYLLQK
jgi:hypothetical protein